MNHHQELDFCTMCSGIEAPSVALEPIGFRARWFAEIEPFPSAVLAHHYPSVPNHGDMTKLIRRILTGAIEAPPLAIAGTPCQAFSVAGWREGLTDPRGALTIKFVETIDAIDLVRTRRSEPECIAWWENVPGVLSDKENAFGCFLGALVGESEELQPPGANGRTLVVCMDPSEQPRGGFWMPNISAWPNDAVVCSLSQVLEQDSIHAKYFLSAKACAGIIRRAEARGKTLPDALLSALRSSAAAGTSST